jgi:hypothetical protein
MLENARPGCKLQCNSAKEMQANVQLSSLGPGLTARCPSDGDFHALHLKSASFHALFPDVTPE